MFYLIILWAHAHRLHIAHDKNQTMLDFNRFSRPVTLNITAEMLQVTDCQRSNIPKKTHLLQYFIILGSWGLFLFRNSDLPTQPLSGLSKSSSSNVNGWS